MNIHFEKLRAHPASYRSDHVTSGLHSFLRSSIDCVTRVFTHSQVGSRLCSLLSGLSVVSFLLYKEGTVPCVTLHVKVRGKGKLYLNASIILKRPKITLAV